MLNLIHIDKDWISSKASKRMPSLNKTKNYRINRSHIGSTRMRKEVSDIWVKNFF
jgi:hypothetical protein